MACAARRLLVLAVVVGTGCNKKSDPAPTPVVTPAVVHVDRMQGSLSLAGKDLPLVACKTGYGKGTWIEVSTAAGTLHFETKQLSWQGELLTCPTFERQWGGGQRADGTVFWRGTLLFQCTGPAGALTGDLKLDCGHATDAERTELDQRGQNVRDTGRP